MFKENKRFQGVRIIEAILDFSNTGEKEREGKRKLEKVYHNREKIYPKEQTQLKKSQVCPASPPEPHPFLNQANISPSHFPEPGKALLLLVPSHTPVLSNPDGTAQNILLRHTAQEGKNRWPQQHWGGCADGAEYLSLTLTHTHRCTHARKLCEIREAHLP